MKFAKHIVLNIESSFIKIKTLSHRYLLKAGLIKQYNAGFYSYSHLAWKIISKVQLIIKYNMHTIYAQEIFMPLLQSSEIWKRSKRWSAYGKELFKLIDRNLKIYCLSPTHEEMITLFIRDNFNSYKQYPLHLYQIQNKFRDELRPQFGLIRTKEFIMKDSYSFDINKYKSYQTYNNIKKLYKTIFNVLYLKHRVVLSDAGNIGGSETHEFCALIKDIAFNLFFCISCKKAYGLKIYEKRLDLYIKSSPCIMLTLKIKITELFLYKLCMKINKLHCLFLKIYNKHRSILILSDNKLNVSVKKICIFLKTKKIFIVNKTIIYKSLCNKYTSLYNEILRKNFFFEDIVVDKFLLIKYNFLLFDMHKLYNNVYPSRDLINKNFTFAHIHKINYLSLCYSCNNILKLESGLEIAHIFFLGSKYSNIFNLSIKNKNAFNQLIEMGCYGIGISRILAALIEQHCILGGIIWPIKIAPFYISVLNSYHIIIKVFSIKMYKFFKKKYIDVLYDNRNANIIKKLKDNEFIGIPILIILGFYFINQNKIEIKNNKITIKQLNFNYCKIKFNNFITIMNKYIFNLLQ